MPVRSDRLASGTVLVNVTTTLFTVPADATYLIKSIYGATNSSTAGLVVVQVQRSPAAAINVLALELTAGKGVRGDIWMACDPGTTVRLFFTGDGSLSYYVSGARLPGAAPEAPSTKPT